MELIAGLTVESAVAHAKDLYGKEHIQGLINIAGEHYQDEALANQDTRQYCNLLKCIAIEKVPHCSISVKPTQIGQGIHRRVFLTNLDKIATEALKQGGIPVELDMEAPPTMDETIDVFCETIGKHPSLLMRLAIPAELRSGLDIAKRVVAAGGGVRLVRGKAYGDIDRSLVFESQDELLDNYIEIAKFVPAQKLALATGNVDLLKRVHAAIGTDDIEHQFLLGLPYHEKVYRTLAAEGKNVSLYMPCGNWERVRGYVGRRNYLTPEEYGALDAKYL